MSWSFPVGRLLGSELRVHVTFVIFLLWIGAARYVEGGAEAAAWGVGLILAIFACVLAHEYGHALAARRYGVATPDITLLPIGGLARLERMPERPGQEIVVALAGPAVNVVIAAVLLALGARPDAAALVALDDPGRGFAGQLAALNLFLAAFNLIPAFPMDGGRVLRALLALRLSRVRATQVAARVGQGLAFVFGFLGLMGNPMLLFIAIFVYIAAGAEARSTGVEDVARHTGVREAMITRFEALGPDSTVGDAVACLLRTSQTEFPVADGAGRPIGALGRDAIIKALSEEGPGTPVRGVMRRDVPVLPVGARLEAALRHLEGGAAVVAVVDAAGRLAGYVTAENVGELMMVRRARPGAEPRGPLLPQ